MACADCVTGFIHEGTPVGKEITLAGLQVYATGDEASDRVIVYGVDIFGWRFVNSRLLADEYASRGFRVLIPDLFSGYEIPMWSLQAVDPVNESSSIKRHISKLLALFVFVPFLLRNSKDAQTAKIGGLIKHLREIQPNAKIGYVGFCWGGRFALTMNSQFDATVACHPSLVAFPGELDGITKPISFAIAETDHHYGAEKAAQTEKILGEKEQGQFEVVVYKGVQHGWTIRTNMADPEKKAARDKVKEQVVSWFENHLSA